MNKIHDKAVIEEGAEIAEGVEIGAYSVIGSNVKIGKNSKILSHTVIEGNTTIGEDNVIYHHCALGTAPQDSTYADEPTVLEIGDGNLIREFVSINRGSLKQEGITKLGDRNMLMAYCHLGHDVIMGNDIRVVNSCNLAGHVTVGNRVVLSGGTSVGQFIRIGEGAFIGGHSGIDKDIPSFCTALGNRVKLKGINIIGLKRLGINKKEISEAVDYYRQMEASNLSPRSFSENIERMKEYEGNTVIKTISEFIKSSKVGIPPFWS